MQPVHKGQLRPASGNSLIWWLRLGPFQTFTKEVVFEHRHASVGIAINNLKQLSFLISKAGSI